MADNDQLNDEYQFAELDPMDPNVLAEGQSSEQASVAAEEKDSVGGAHVKRNAIIAVSVFIFIILAYKFIASYFSNSNMMVSEKASTPAVQSPMVPESQSIVTPTPVPEPVVQKSETNSAVYTQLETMTSKQDALSSEVASVNTQIGTITSNINTLTSKIAELSQVITNLNNKIEMQSHVIEQLSAKPVVKVIHHAYKKRGQAHIKYYLQAVIPGRAWIVATNGNTLTVREGSMIPGYGLVKLIDPNQGRVITSSGQLIRFSQEDS